MCVSVYIYTLLIDTILLRFYTDYAHILFMLAFCVYYEKHFMKAKSGAHTYIFVYKNVSNIIYNRWLSHLASTIFHLRKIVVVVIVSFFVCVKGRLTVPFMK